MKGATVSGLVRAAFPFRRQISFSSLLQQSPPPPAILPCPTFYHFASRRRPITHTFPSSAFTALSCLLHQAWHIESHTWIRTRSSYLELTPSSCKIHTLTQRPQPGQYILRESRICHQSHCSQSCKPSPQGLLCRIDSLVLAVTT